ncbi:MAG: 6-carboxytetrahydropterin synthase QueD [Chloroflexota bacterium]
MFEIAVEGHFDAAHYLRGYQGKCEALHGHRYRVMVKLAVVSLNEIGLAYDFTRLKAELGDILKQFDHVLLNDVPPFDRLNPSAENIAVAIYQELKPVLGTASVSLKKVEVWESPDSSASYIPD